MAHMSDDGSTFVLTRDPAWTGSPESCIRFSTIFSTSTGRPLGTTANFQGCVESAAFSHDSKILALGVTDCTEPARGSLEFHDLVDPKNKVAGILLPSAPRAIAFHPTEAKIAVVCYAGELVIARVGMRSIETWADSTNISTVPNNAQVDFSKDGKFLICLRPDGAIEVRDASSGLLPYPPIKTDPKNFWSFSLSSTGNFMATTTTHGEVKIWDLEQGFPISGTLEHPSWVYKSQFSPDNRTLVTTSHDGYVRLWDWHAAKLLAEPMLHPGHVYDAAFTPDAEYVLTACQDGNLRMFDPLTGQILAEPLRVGRQAFNIAISPDGKRAVLGSLNNSISVISLELLSRKIPFDTQELSLWAEVVSSATIQNGVVRDLTTTEWVERFTHLTSIHPELPAFSDTFSKENFIIHTMPVFTSSLVTSRLPYPEPGQLGQ